MSKLNCDERSCRHNCQCVCKKQSIIVDEDAICCSYQTKNSSALEEFASDSFADVETFISCNEESCIFNHDSACKAQEVKIDSDAWCSTYRRR